uniref:Beta-galactosidase n=1 Tax=Periplaneta americana TaxID=6978 RepID=A0A059WCP0_PERAM|nr:beta-galactosidase [Periplaneta americana]
MFNMTLTSRIVVAVFTIVLLTAVSGSLVKGKYAQLPTLYEYYTEGGILAGLETLPDTFLLNNKNITLFSGTIHYFRVHPQYWRDRLRKLRAAGFNAVETYVPWNLHEPQQGVFDFGNGGNDMSEFLDIVTYLKTAQEEDLFVILRPSPYICAEWEFGGMPSWLLRYPDLVVRSSQSQFVDLVKEYNANLIPLLVDLQFTKGGPIIAVQLENEYGSLAGDGSEEDVAYLSFLKEDYEKYGIVELLFTSDSSNADKGGLPGVLQTANFQSNPEGMLSQLKNLHPDKPAMAMEYWTGWFDHWFESHHTTSVAGFRDVLERILVFPASVNLYMFHGGTSFGFLNGANGEGNSYGADVTSYDYDAPLSEAGDYTDKYDACVETVAKYNKVLTKVPSPPEISKKMAYNAAPITGQLDFNQIIDKIPAKDRANSDNVVHMEALPVNNGNGQSYGYVLYRHADTSVTTSSVLQVKNDAIYDMGIVMLDGERKTEKLTSVSQVGDFGFWILKDATLVMNSTTSGTKTLDILVENWGRVNFGYRSTFDQRKGLRENTEILIDNNEITGWEVISLQFKSNWVNSLDGWQPVSSEMIAPKLLHATLEVDTPYDTFLDMRGWGRGAVFINGFNIGRYFSAGPSHTLYVPAPLLKTGTNDIAVFELFTAGNEIVFADQPYL